MERKTLMAFAGGTFGFSAMVLDEHRRVVEAAERERLRDRAKANLMASVAAQPESRQVRRARERKERAH